MKRRRRLRKLVPDAALIRRRAAGEPFRPLASDYDVAHTTLGRYFERPEVAKQVRQAAKQLQAEQRVAAARRAAERRLEQEVRRKAREQAAREREDERRANAAVREIASRPRRSRSPFAALLDEHDARQPLTRADLHSQDDDIAAAAVAKGGGIQDVIDATDSRTLENVVNLIDPAILKDAYDNDLLRQAQPPPPD
jgi:signal transduction histidine kinase